MLKVFSTKLDNKVLQVLSDLCRDFHLKKSSILEELILDGARRKRQALELAQSIELGLEQEKEGNLLSSDEVEDRVFGKKK